ncbi:MAG TPA: MEDS domain-containing protein [Anaeromyxobacter sp.]
MAARTPELPANVEDRLGDLGPHDHLCLIYETRGEQLRTMIPFLRQGLEHGDRCVYVADGDTAAAASDAMRAGGVPVDEAVERGALLVAGYRQIYLAPGRFEPDAVLDFAAGAGHQAASDGYRALRIAGEMAWALRGDPGADRILEYERKVNERIPSTPVTAVCQYDRSRFSPEVIRDVIRTHPLVVVGNRVCRNFYYVPPGELLGPGVLDREVDRLLENIVERERAEDALRESERRLSLVLEGSHDAFWDWDIASGTLVHSARWATFLGRPPAEQRGDLETLRAVTHPEDWPALRRALDEHLAGRSDRFQLEHRVRASDGSWRWVLSRGKVVARAGGRPQRMAGTATDVTERRSLQARLETAGRLASVGTLAAGVAHEINNPLSFVTSNLGFIAERLDAAAGDAAHPLPRAAELKQAVAEAIDGAQRVRDIVQALRRVAGPARAEQRGRVDVRAEIEAAAGIAKGQVGPRARLVLDLPAALPPVIAGPHELGQVVLNLLVNAAQATPEGNPDAHEVRVTARAGEGRVVIEVSDTGRGMAPAVVARIFDPFFTTKDVGAGTGLGLAICHGIVTAAGGSIEVHSEPGRGTRFRVELPAAEDGSTSPSPPPPAPAPARRRVLVVDDESLLARAYARVLGRDHEVEALTSAAEALRLLAAGRRWDVIICDLLMPGMTGMDLAEWAAREAPDVAPRLIFVTGGACTERSRAFLERGGFPWLEKPVEPEALRAAVARTAERAR